jgi:serine/threonine-protein kinase
MIGEKLGKYTILQNIGTGSMGTVYKAEDPLDRRLVAVKLVRANVLYDAGRRERFLQGLLAASEIQHPGISPILEIGDDGDDFFVITPFLKGETLAQLLRAHTLDWRRSLRIAISVGEAVSAVHASRAIHCALKPANVWMQGDHKVLVTDCCIGRFTEIDRSPKPVERQARSESADTIIPMGALEYMSPEQVLGEQIDCRSDIFSLGVILYEMLAGRHPFEARNSFSRMSAIVEAEPASLGARKLALPPEFDQILSRALAKKPANRYQNVEDMLKDLRALENGATVPEILQSDPSPRLSLRLKTAGYWVLAILVLFGLAAILYRILSR